MWICTGFYSRKGGSFQLWQSQELAGRCVCSLRQKTALWMQVFVIIFVLNVAPGTRFWKGLLQMGPVWACLSSLLGCFVFRLLLWASPSLDIEAHGQLIPNVLRHFLPACRLYFNFRASFVFKRLKTDNNGHVVGHSLNLQFIFFPWGIVGKRCVCLTLAQSFLQSFRVRSLNPPFHASPLHNWGQPLSRA